MILYYQDSAMCMVYQTQQRHNKNIVNNVCNLQSQYVYVLFVGVSGSVLWLAGDQPT